MNSNQLVFSVDTFYDDAALKISNDTQHIDTQIYNAQHNNLKSTMFSISRLSINANQHKHQMLINSTI